MLGDFHPRRWSLALALLACVLLSACAAPPAAPKGSRQAAAQQSSGPKGLLRIAWAGEPPSLSPKMAAPGGSAFNELAITFNSAMTYYDPTGSPIPQLAAEIPTIENGGWIVNADGTMVTTYKLRPAKWHDGAPITAR